MPAGSLDLDVSGEAEKGHSPGQSLLLLVPVLSRRHPPLGSTALEPPQRPKMMRSLELQWVLGAEAAGPSP